MYELEKLGDRTYYIKSPNNVGVFRINDEEVYLIDAGGDKDTGKKILKIMEMQGWKVKAIINTHSHADHIGGDKLIQERTKCKVFAYGIEKVITQYPILEPSFLYGGFPFNELKNKFLMAKAPENVESLRGKFENYNNINETNNLKNVQCEIEKNLPEGLEILCLPGHSYEMIGIKTSDNVYFIADSLFSKETIEKYHLFFIYDVAGYLQTLDMLETLKGKAYVPSHNEMVTNLNELISLNRSKVNEICETILQVLETPMTFEKLLKAVFDKYNLVMNTNQYVLVGSTLRSYLAYLKNNEKVDFEFEQNEMVWKKNVNK